ncbi:ras-related protein Rab-5B isoform X2 [Amia ocellicauda]|uniref:ras-related protein Rab-5B isoform X2 n=1 Tax=Amia ocellicauda TaxID=2972642 RepID=UPI003464AD45|nr:RAB5B protein [Amia calva]
MTERKLSVRSKASSVSSVGGPAVEKRTLRVKMVLLGSSGVGKSSLAIRFTKDEFRCTVPTVGSAYLTHLVCLYDTTLRFEIWDTAGQEKYHSVTPLYYRGAQAALVVYDITKRESFARAQLWLKELERQYFLGETAVALVGNKGDLDDLREVALQEGQTLAENKGLLFMETSAKSGNKVSELLLAIAHKVRQSTGDEGMLTEWRDSCVDLHAPQTQHRPTPCCVAL